MNRHAAIVDASRSRPPLGRVSHLGCHTRDQAEIERYTYGPAIRRLGVGGGQNVRDRELRECERRAAHPSGLI